LGRAGVRHGQQLTRGAAMAFSVLEKIKENDKTFKF
jgi:hypothetical protein